MAVLTDGNPSHEYGTETLRGVAQRLFRRAPAARPAGLVDVHRFGPGMRVKLSYRTKHKVHTFNVRISAGRPR